MLRLSAIRVRAPFVLQWLDRTLVLTLHQPNRSPDKRARLFRLKDRDNRICLADST
jgi:hypothetical protein